MSAIKAPKNSDTHLSTNKQIMKKPYSFLTAIFLVMSLLTVTACGGDGDDDVILGGDIDKAVVGDWGYRYVSSDESEMYLEWISLKSNGQFTITDYDVFGSGLDSGGSIFQMDKSQYSGTYTAKDGQLRMTANGREQVFYYRVSGSVMSLTAQGTAYDYDKFTDAVKGAFESAESTYQQRFRK